MARNADVSLETLRAFLDFLSKATLEVDRPWQPGTARVHPLRLCASNASADEVPSLVWGGSSRSWPLNLSSVSIIGLQFEQWHVLRQMVS